MKRLFRFICMTHTRETLVQNHLYRFSMSHIWYETADLGMKLQTWSILNGSETTLYKEQILPEKSSE